MGATLDALHKLQVIDQQVRSVRDRIESKVRAAKARQRKVTVIQQQIDSVHKKIRDAQAEADRLELERKTHESHAAKLRETLNRTKTNKEYAAILSELNTDKADQSKLEDTILAALGRVDEFKREEAELIKSRDEADQRAKDMEAQADKLREKYKDKLKSLEAKHEEAASQVPAEPRMLFERAAEKHEGEGMAMIEKTHPKRAEYTCSGCNMTLTLETVNALQSKDTVECCQTCGRILYLEEPSHAGV